MAKKEPTTKKTTKKRQAAPVPLGAREKLLNEARTLFAEHGFDGVSVREISRRSSLNVSLISYYFGGKEGLYIAILQEHSEGIAQILRRTLDSLKSHDGLSRDVFKKMIESFIRGMVEMRLESSEMSRIIQRERFSGLPFARGIHEEIFKPLAAEFDVFMKEAAKKKIIRTNIPVEPYFLSIIEAIMGYFIFLECGMKLGPDCYRLPQDKEQYIEFLTRLYTEGVYR